MRITSLETLRPAFQPNVCVVQLHTDQGLVGLGESFFHAPAVESYMHTAVAPLLAGMVDPTPEAVALLLAPYVGFQGGGVENRANGAIDIALWDLLGKRANLRVVDLLGGAVRKSVRIYNTCAGTGYVGGSSRQESANWGAEREGRYEDLRAFLTDPAALARELRDEGITGMKIWPFDTAAEKTRGTEISPADLDAGIHIVEEIRNAVGMDIDVMIELHGLWNMVSAAKIIDALAPYRPYWVEDPVRADAVSALSDLRRGTNIPIAVGETCVGRRGFLPLLTSAAVDIVTVDVQWTGGLTEARKIASLADAFGVPVAPHDCTGPITLAACTHLTLSQPNGLLQETVRAFLRSWYPEVVEGMPVIENGQISLSDEPGLGVRLVDGFAERSDVDRRVTEA